MSLEAMPVEGQIELARAQLRETHDLLASAGRAATARLIEAAFEFTLPNLVDSAAVTPVYHSTTLMQIVAGTSREDALSDFDTRVLLLSASVHDMCLAAADRALASESVPADVPRKIRAADVRKADGERKKLLVSLGIRQRMLHGKLASIETPDLLRAASSRSGEPADPAEIARIQQLVQRHDLPSVAELKLEVGEDISVSDLFRPDERLELRFRGVDRLWMVTPVGVDVDVLRDLVSGAAEPLQALRARRIESNARRHFEEYELYRRVYRDEIHLFGFIDDSLYVSPAAFRAFRGFTGTGLCRC